ncbi:MAG: autotransporter outer membrane beta-barrel domain-containing protein [Bacteroidota bacterium]
MMDDQQFNELIKNKINQYDSPIDLDQAWTDLSNRKERRKTAIFWWFSLGAGLLLSLLAIWFWPDSRPIEQESVIEQETARVLPPMEIRSTNPKTLKTEALKIGQKLPQQDSEELVKSPVKEEKQPLVIDHSTILLKKKEQASTFNTQVISQALIQPVKPGENLEGSHASTPREIQLITALPTKGIHLLVSPTEPKSIASNNIRINTDIVPNGRWRLYVQTGIGQTWEQFNTPSTDAASYRQLRENSETSLESVGLALGFTYQFAPKWTWSAGVQYTSTYTRLEFEQVTNPTYELENVLLRIRRFSSGEEEQVFGDTTVIGTRRVQVRHFNHYQSYSLNTMLSYELWQSKRWSLQVAGGLVWNLRLQVDGRILGPENNEFLDVVDNGAIYKRSLNLGLRSSVQLSYRIHSKWDIYVQPDLVFFQSNALQSDQSLRSRMTRGLLNMGVQYRIGK